MITDILIIVAGIVLALTALGLYGLLAAASGTPVVGFLLLVGGLAWGLALALLLKQLEHELKTRRPRPPAGERGSTAAPKPGPTSRVWP